MSDVMSMAKMAAMIALPSSQVAAQFPAGMRLPRMTPFTSPTPRTMVCVPSGSVGGMFDKRQAPFGFEDVAAPR